MQQWRRFSGRKIHQLIEQEIRQIIEAELANGCTIKVCIGSDSQVRVSKINFATVVVFRRKSKGAFMCLFITKLYNAK